jgi:hypothetical protein
MARQTIGPATLGQNSAPLEGYGAASEQIHLARGPVVGHTPRVPMKGRMEIDSY